MIGQDAPHLLRGNPEEMPRFFQSTSRHTSPSPRRVRTAEPGPPSGFSRPSAAMSRGAFTPPQFEPGVNGPSNLLALRNTVPILYFPQPSLLIGFDPEIVAVIPRR